MAVRRAEGRDPETPPGFASGSGCHAGWSTSEGLEDQAGNKGPSLQHVPDAWRILSHACLNNCVLPAIAEWNHRESLQRFEHLQQPEEPAGSGRGTGFAMPHSTPAGSSMDTTEPASPTGLEPVDKRSKVEPVLDDFEADYDADEAPEGNIQPDKVQISVDDFQEATNVDTAGFLARAKGPVFDSPAQRLGLETVTATQDLFPEYLQPGNLKKHFGVSKAMELMQELKARAPEHVRYRHAILSRAGAQIHGSLVEMKRSLRQAVVDSKDTGKPP